MATPSELPAGRSGASVPGTKYVGPVFDCSGYAEAARNYVLALHAAGWPLTLSPTSHTREQPDLGEVGELLRSLVDRPLDYDKVIVHSTPENWRILMQGEEQRYKIGATVWETSGLHPVWVRACSQADEVWVPCAWNASVFGAALDGIPVVRIPYPVEVPKRGEGDGLELAPGLEGAFIFYSIFEWQERKNPDDLVLTYLSAFSGIRDVALVLRTHAHNDSLGGETVDERIARLKRSINLPHYPKIVTITRQLDRDEIAGLHRRGDCFVLLQRSEGWGLPHIEAAAHGNPVVTTAYGSVSDFLTDDTAYLVDYSLRPVSGMPWSAFYLGTERWASPDLDQAAALMRQVYENRDEARRVGQRARAAIAERFSHEAVGRMMTARLHAIDRERAGV